MLKDIRMVIKLYIFTLWGNDASEQSGEGVSHLPISYERHISTGWKSVLQSHPGSQ